METCQIPAEGTEHLPAIAPHCRRFWLIVLDGLGIGQGEAGEAWAEDAGADTFGSVRDAVGHLAVPYLERLGLRELLGEQADEAPAELLGSSMRLVPLSLGKDTLTGHWELAGLVTQQRMRTFPQGFPPELLARLGEAFGRGVLGGMPASGTAVIEQYGREHIASGEPIVYTSADSVLQIAAHREVLPPARLYEMCGAARQVMQGEWLVGRVIARPFYGEPGHFRRDSAGRRDFSVQPPGATVLDEATEAGIEVVAIGKIADVFAGRGISRVVKASGNDAVLRELAALRREGQETGAAGGGRRQLIFANLNDFDSLYGHRRDAAGFAVALEQFDQALGWLLPNAEPGAEILAVTADHGCDPGRGGTDHTRETVPLFVAGTGWPPACLGTVRGLTAVAGLISGAFGLQGFHFWPRRVSVSGGTVAGKGYREE